jgi:hypothetical protein
VFQRDSIISTKDEDRSFHQRLGQILLLTRCATLSGPVDSENKRANNIRTESIEVSLEQWFTLFTGSFYWKDEIEAIERTTIPK